MSEPPGQVIRARTQVEVAGELSVVDTRFEPRVTAAALPGYSGHSKGSSNVNNSKETLVGKPKAKPRTKRSSAGLGHPRPKPPLPLLPQEPPYPPPRRTSATNDSERDISLVETRTEPAVPTARLPGHNDCHTNNTNNNNDNVHHHHESASSFEDVRALARQYDQADMELKGSRSGRHTSGRTAQAAVLHPGDPENPSTIVLYAQAVEPVSMVTTTANMIPTIALPASPYNATAPKYHRTSSGDGQQRQRRCKLYALIAVVGLVLIGGVVAVVVVVLPSSDDTHTNTTTINDEAAINTAQCSMTVNNDDATCARLMSNTRVDCECYSFCGQELVGCLSYDKSSQASANSIQCEEKFVAGCQRNANSNIDNATDSDSSGDSSFTADQEQSGAQSPTKSPDQVDTQSPPTTTDQDEPESPPSTTSLVETPTSATLQPTTLLSVVAPVLDDFADIIPTSTIQALGNSASPQFMAYQWLEGHPDLETMDDQRIVQLFALVTIYYATQSWDFDARDDWLDYSVHECAWIVPTEFGDKDADCTLDDDDDNDDKFFQRLVLDSDSLKGTFPVEVSLLSNLLTLDLQGNYLMGTIPKELGESLTQLSLLDLRNNQFLSGTVPTTLGLLTALTRLDLRGNSLTGKLPEQLEELTRLEGLWLDNNSFSGTLPVGLCSLTTWTVGIWVDCDSGGLVCPCEGLCECAKK